MQSLGLPAQNTLLGSWNGEIVVACEDFRKDNEELHEFSWYMQNILSKAEIGKIPTYEQLYKVMFECPLLKSVSINGIHSYWEMIIGDALIGNFDRHKNNFGFIVNKKTGEIKPSPIYDCGSSLYQMLAEEKFKAILANPEEIKQRIYQYPSIALNKNSNKNKEEKFKYFEFLSSGYDREATNALLRIYPRIDMEKIYRIIDETPFISDLRKNFYKQMLTYRKELILDKSYELLNGFGRTVLEEKSPKKRQQVEYGD